MSKKDRSPILNLKVITLPLGSSNGSLNNLVEEYFALRDDIVSHFQSLRVSGSSGCRHLLPVGTHDAYRLSRTCRRRSDYNGP
jgi:hypothetical protein